MHRARVYRTEAIVLRKTDLGETDQIVVLCTPESGQVRAIAKGVRRPGGRLAGHLEHFAYCDLLLARGRELAVVAQAQSQRSFSGIRCSLERTLQAFHLVELVERLVAPGAENRQVFEELLGALRCLDGWEGDTTLAWLYWRLRLLSAGGFRPRLTNCVACGVELQPGPHRFSHRLGGAMCLACGPEDFRSDLIPLDVLKLLRHLQRSAGPEAARVQVGKSTVSEATRLLNRYSDYVVDSEMKSAEFVAKLVGP